MVGCIALFPKYEVAIAGSGVCLFLFCVSLYFTIFPRLSIVRSAEMQMTSKLSEHAGNESPLSRRVMGILGMGIAGYLFWLHVLPKL
jgi:hypothetical protein